MTSYTECVHVESRNNLMTEKCHKLTNSQVQQLQCGDSKSKLHENVNGFNYTCCRPSHLLLYDATLIIIINEKFDYFYSMSFMYYDCCSALEHFNLIMKCYISVVNK